ncbi:hypothetical protein [Actinoplanes sp. NPDC049265]|uniref:hypothetical protein n=1 Tax=Actinoplanes sp. NPDC049265 TaxID=3363902 RepID=UPI00371C2752
MKRVLVAVALVFLAAGCGTETPAAAPPPSSAPPSSTPSIAPSSAAPTPSKTTPAPKKTKPTFTDLTQGNSRSVVKLVRFDPDNSSTVVEPIKFLTNVCKDDPECHREWDSEDSHSKVTVPLADKVKYFEMFDKDGNPCVTDKPDDGGTCPTNEGKFTAWAKENPKGMVNVTIVNGEITKMAQIYTP